MHAMTGPNVLYYSRWFNKSITEEDRDELSSFLFWLSFGLQLLSSIQMRYIHVTAHSGGVAVYAQSAQE